MLYSRLKRYTVVDKISYVLLAIAIGVYATAQGLIHNPDQDCYFLIDVGRYIVNNRSLPTTAYWLINSDVPTIIQQWICDVVNYLAYALAGYTGVIVLAILFNLILLCCLFVYCRETLKSNQVGLNVAIYCWILLGQFASTRPYSITISVSLLELTLLNRFFSKEKHTLKETLIFLAGIAAIFVFQVNWQASNILYPILWILCYLPIIKIKKFSINFYAVMALVTGILFSVVSPLGVKGPLFLIYARSSFEKFSQYEVLPPKFPSIYTIMQVMVIALLCYAIIKRKVSSISVFLALGCFLMSCVYMRCCWTLILPIGDLLANLSFTERTHKMMRWTYVAAGLLSVFLIFKYNLEKNDDKANMIASVPAPDQVTLYTDFNSGSYFLIDGYKIYYDARPELYGKKIAGDKAFLDEAYATWSGEIDYGIFIDKYGFDWFAVTADSYMQDYLENNQDYELVYSNNTDKINVFRKVSD